MALMMSQQPSRPQSGRWLEVSRLIGRRAERTKMQLRFTWRPQICSMRLATMTRLRLTERKPLLTMPLLRRIELRQTRKPIERRITR